MTGGGLEARHRLVDPPGAAARFWHRARLSRPRGSSPTPSTLGRLAYASVYPLVSARAVARPFTYEVPDDVGKGAVVAVRFGRSRARGVVVGLEEAPPEGVKATPVGRVLDEVPPALVDLALWIAEYYGSTPPPGRSSSSRPSSGRTPWERPVPAARGALGGEAAPGGRSARAGGRGRPHRRRGRPRRRRFLLYGATGSGKTEVYLQACEAALERGLAISAGPEMRLHAPGRRPFRDPLRRPDRDPPFRARGRGAAAAP